MRESIGKEIWPEGSEGATERVVSAAVRYNGEVFKALFHLDAVEKLKSKFSEVDLNKVEEGYVTSTGRFVDRNEGENLPWHIHSYAD